MFYFHYTLSLDPFVTGLINFLIALLLFRFLEKPKSLKNYEKNELIKFLERIETCLSNLDLEIRDMNSSRKNIVQLTNQLNSLNNNLKNKFNSEGFKKYKSIYNSTLESKCNQIFELLTDDDSLVDDYFQYRYENINICFSHIDESARIISKCKHQVMSK